VTRYLLDTNVLREFGPNGHRNVRAWLRTVDVGEKDKHRDDMALAATARVQDLVLVTRNVADFRGRNARVLDPFKANPTIMEI
jgi:predicted nucleic acid-binding protein